MKARNKAKPNDNKIFQIRNRSHIVLKHLLMKMKFRDSVEIMFSLNTILKMHNKSEIRVHIINSETRNNVCIE